MTKSNTKPINPESVFRHGCDFEFAAMLLGLDNKRRLDALVERMKTEAVNDSVLPTLHPFVVNAALALELYFKSLILLETGQPRYGHELHELFLAITPARQQRIEEVFNQKIADSAYHNHIKTKFPTEFANLQIPKVLEHANNAFVEYRYVYEGIKTANQIAFGPVVPATREVILEIKPDWNRLIPNVLKSLNGN